MHNDTLAAYILPLLQAKAETDTAIQPLLDALTEEQMLFREFSGRDSR